MDEAQSRDEAWNAWQQMLVQQTVTHECCNIANQGCCLEVLFLGCSTLLSEGRQQVGRSQHISSADTGSSTLAPPFKRDRPVDARHALQERHALLLKLKSLFAAPMHPLDFCAAAASADLSRSDNAPAVPASDADWLLVGRDPSPEDGLTQDMRHAGASSFEHQAHGRRPFEQSGSRRLAAGHEQAVGVQGADAPSSNGPSVSLSEGVQQANRAYNRTDIGDDSRGVAPASESWRGDSADNLQQPKHHSYNPQRDQGAAKDDLPSQSGRHQTGR